MNPRNNIKVSLKNPSDFFEHKQNEVLVKELARKKLEEEEKLKNKKFAAPKEYFGEDKEVVAEIIKEEEIKEETPVNPPEVKSYDEDIKRLQEKVDSVYDINWDDGQALGSGATSTVRIAINKTTKER